MDDYHEFRHPHEIQIQEWLLYWSPNYVYIIKGIVAPNGVMIIINISSVSRNENVNSNGAIGSGGTIEGGAIGASTIT
jgi:hypothetical protein